MTSEDKKRERAERARAYLDILSTRYPACFTQDASSLRPLAIGIQRAIREDEAKLEEAERAPGWVVRMALSRYTRSTGYLKAVVAGVPRCNLDGSDAGPISEQARAFATTELEARAQRKENAKVARARAQARRQRAREQAERTEAANREAAPNPPATAGDRPSRPPRRGPAAPEQQQRRGRRQERGQRERRGPAAAEATPDSPREGTVSVDPLAGLGPEERRQAKLEALMNKFNRR